MTSRLLLLSAVLILIVGAVAVGGTPAQAQCSPRADWPTYTVVRSDTLFSIARRYQTNVVTLAQANCLRNINVIVLGQELRVPPSTVTPTTSATAAATSSGTAAGNTTPSAAATTSGTATAAPAFTGNLPTVVGTNPATGATYQPFENGFMIWRGDIGTIWVFSTRLSRMVEFPLSKYGGLGIPRILNRQVPVDRSLPLNGFRKVYDNFPEVPAALGFAIGGEQGYNMTVTPGEGGRTSAVVAFTLSLPNRTYVRVNLDGTFANASQPPSVTLPPAPTAAPTAASTIAATAVRTEFSTGATYQRFENGFMVWRADTNEIDVFIGQTSGPINVFTQFMYGRLPTRGDLVPPETRRLPNGGFNRVWANNDSLRAQIGWAYGNEAGYTMTLRGGNPPTSFSLPNGQFVTKQSELTWQAPALSPLPPTPTPAIAPLTAPVATTAPTAAATTQGAVVPAAPTAAATQ